jgi:hypothetical protein
MMGRTPEFEINREKKIRDDLIHFARNGSPESKQDELAEAEANWASARTYLPLMLLVLMGLSGAGARFCLPGSAGSYMSYIGLAVFAVALIGALVTINAKHKKAYVERLIVKGVSRHDAERHYDNTYNG